MHHALRFYSANQELVIRFHMFGGSLTRLPLVGGIIKSLLDRYAVTQHAAWSLTPGEAKKVIAAATSIAVGDCKCRKVFKNCDRPVRTDIVFGVGFDVFTDVRKDEYESISKEEAFRIIDECKEKGLIQMLLRCRNDMYALCNCCTCCCVPLRLKKDYGIKNVVCRGYEI